MSIDPNLLVIKPVDELESVTGLQAGELLFYDGSNNLKLINIDTFNNLSKTAKPISPTDPTPTIEGLYIPTESGTYSNAGGLIAQEGYYTLFFLDGVNWTKSETELPMIEVEDVVEAKIENAPSSNAVFDFVPTQINTINLFNKKTFKEGYGFNTSTGEIIPVNPQNAISDFISVEGGEVYGWAVMSNELSPTSIYPKNNINGFFIVEYDINKSLIKYTDVLSGCNITTDVNTKWICINPNSSDGFQYFRERFVFNLSKNFPFGFIDYNGGKLPKFQGDLQFYTKRNIAAFNSDIGSTFSNEILTIPSGNLTLLNEKLFECLFVMQYSGKARVVIKINGDIRDVLPTLLTGMEIVLTNNSVQPSMFLYESDNIDEFYVVAEGNFNNGDLFAFIKEGVKNINLSSPIVAKLEFYFLYYDENGKPRNAGDVTEEDLNDLEASIPGIVDARINDTLPDLINQQIGSDLNSYFTDHIDDFTFLQPNYIQANSSFDLSSLTSAMNGKFISIIEDIDLGGATIDFVTQGVKNLKLVFNGGRILNGKIKSNYTRCIFNSNEAFVNVEILNQFQNPFALPEWFGAKIDGIDGGIGDFSKDDSFAVNQAIKFTSKVLFTGNRTTIIKKPIILRSGSTVIADGNFTIKLGDASNCTLLKNEHIDLPITGDGVVTYPSGFVRNSNITIKGGIWDGNGLKQARGYNDRPDVDGTPQFIDGDGTDYIGFMMKFADIDGLVMEDITLKDARTYMVAAGGLNHYRFNNILMQRSFKMENADGIHLHGHNYDGAFDNIVGTAGDDLIAVTTKEAQGLSIRIGDVKKLRIRNVYNYGFSSGATLDDPKLNTDGTNPETNVYRPIRLTYTDNVIDDVFIENVIGYKPQFISMIVMSYLPLTGALNIGKIGSVTIKGLYSQDLGLCLDIGGNTKIDYINLKDTKVGFEQSVERIAIIKPLENWSNVDADYALSKVGTISVDTMHVTHGNTAHNAADGLFYTWGRIDNLIIDKLVIEDKTSANQSFESLISGNIGYVSVSNSKIAVQKVFSTEGNTNSNIVFKECNNEWGSFVNGIYSTNTVPGVIVNRMNTESIVLSSNPSVPKFGDKILKSDGMYLYSGTWNKL